MMRNFVYLIFLLIACSLNGCGEKKSISREIPTANDQLDKLPPDTNFAAAVADWDVRCPSTGPCPESVGQFILKIPGGISICTATLIAPDIAVANSHCIPAPTLRSADEQCRHAGYVVFPEIVGHQEREIARCEKIVVNSGLPADDQKTSAMDYVFIKFMNPVTRSITAISRAGMKDGEFFNIYKVDPLEFGLSQMAYVDNCEVIHKTVLGPRADSQFSGVHIFKNCEVVHGNSGSPVLDAKGELRGIVSAAITADSPDDSGFVQLDIKVDQLKIFIANNAACFDLSFLVGAGLPHADCKPTPKSILAYQYNEERSAAEVVQRMTADAQKQKIDPRFEYTFSEYSSPTSEMKKYLYRPICFKDSHLWVPESEETVYLTTAVFDMDLVIDDRLQLTIVPQPATHQMVFTFNPNELQKTGASEVTIYNLNETSLAENEVWPMCESRESTHDRLARQAAVL